MFIQDNAKPPMIARKVIIILVRCAVCKLVESWSSNNMLIDISIWLNAAHLNESMSDPVAELNN